MHTVYYVLSLSYKRISEQAITKTRKPDKDMFQNFESAVLQKRNIFKYRLAGINKNSLKMTLYNKEMDNSKSNVMNDYFYLLITCL